MIEEEIIYYFNQKDLLEKKDVTQNFVFNTREAYEDFISKGKMYRYTPDKNTDGGTKQNEEENIFSIFYKEDITSSYKDVVQYEEVIAKEKKEGYTCEEKVERE